jgi:hypothetical protein
VNVEDPRPLRWDPGVLPSAARFANNSGYASGLLIRGPGRHTRRYPKTRRRQYNPWRTRTPGIEAPMFNRCVDRGPGPAERPGNRLLLEREPEGLVPGLEAGVSQRCLQGLGALVQLATELLRKVRSDSLHDRIWIRGAKLPHERQHLSGVCRPRLSATVACAMDELCQHGEVPGGARCPSCDGIVLRVARARRRNSGSTRRAPDALPSPPWRRRCESGP